jgi:hypothetical protein
MQAYDEIYIPYIMRNQGKVFFYIREVLPNVDEKWFIEKYMKSRVRRLLDHANPKFAAMPPPELIYYFIHQENDGEYKRGEKWGGFLPQWVGMAYAMYQWRYNIPSGELIDILPLSEMERIYPALHQAGWDTVMEKIRFLLSSSFF